MVEKVRTDANFAHSTLRERVPAGTVLPAGGAERRLSACLGLVDDGQKHVGSMARPTTDDNITLYDDAVFCDSERLKTCVWTRQALPALGMLGCGTQ